MPLALVMESSALSFCCTGYQKRMRLPAVLVMRSSSAVKSFPLMFITAPLPLTFTSSSNSSTTGTRWPVR